MKRVLIPLIALVCLTLLAGALFLRFGLGAPVPSPSAVFDVAGGMAAKLGCSARHITGLAPEQVTADLASYSAAYGWVTITNRDADRRVEARLGPGKTHSATYRPVIGCTLDIGDTGPLDNLTLAVPAARKLANSGTADALLAHQLTQDNAAGLHSRALLAMHDGQIVGEAYAPGFANTTPLLGWSMGKSLIAILLGRMEMESGLKVSETALFEEWQDDRSKISIENLLQMSSGLEFEEIYAPGSDATRMLFNEYSASNVALKKPAAYAPGSHFAYSSGTTNILSRLLFDRLGGTPEKAYQFLQTSVLAPLGMADTVVESDPSGVFVGSSYVYASARNWAQLGQLLLSDGVYNGQRLLSSDWIRRATTPNTSNNEPRYGYQLWLNRGGTELRWPDLPPDAFAMQGNRAQIVLMIPSRKLVFVRLGWTAGEYPYNETFSDWLANVGA